MPRRSFVPEAPDGLENRTVLSAAGAVPLSGLRYNMALAMIRGGFEQYATSGVLPRLQLQLQQQTSTIPFGKADGLGTTISGILDQMQADLASHAPRPIASAYLQVVQAIRSDVHTRIANGSIVVGK